MTGAETVPSKKSRSCDEKMPPAICIPPMIFKRGIRVLPTIREVDEGPIQAATLKPMLD